MALGDFELSSQTAPGIEVSSFADLALRRGGAEFRGLQRLDFSILLLVSGGQATHMVDFTSYRLGAGDVLWIRRGQVHEWGRDFDNLTGAAVAFDSHVLPADVSATIDYGARSRCYWPKVLTTSPEVSAGATFIYSIAITPRPGPAAARGTALAQAIAALLVSLTLTEGSWVPEPESRATSFAAFMRAVEMQLDAAPNVRSVARALGVSQKTLDRTARAHTGLSAKTIIDDRVVLEAKRLLVHTNSPIGAIARGLGYMDSGNFCRYFLRVAGSTPAQFRANARRVD